MQFDVRGATQVTVSYAAFGKDAPSGWQLWASADHGRTYAQIDSTHTANSHILQQASFTIHLQGSLRFEIRKVSGGKNRINIDDFTINPAHGTTGGGGQVIAGDDSNLLLGNPSGASASTANADNYLIDHHYYIESYNRDKGGPNWVCWHIGAGDLGSTDRLNNFRPDSLLPSGWFESSPEFYIGTGFDKGHNCPSADRTSSSDANSATFLMDNIVPQAPNNNQHTWEQFESYCRDQVKSQGDEVYVIMGSYGSGGTGRNGYTTSIANGRITVPAHIWKVAVIIPNGNHDLMRIDANAQVIAINTPNDNSISPNWTNYVCTVSDIEKATGYHLFTTLPSTVRSALENKRFTGGM